MTVFVIIETQDGLTIATVPPGVSPAGAAEREGGMLVDTNRYSSYEEAYDAMLSLQSEEEEAERYGA